MTNVTAPNIRASADNMADVTRGSIGETAKAAGTVVRDASRKIAGTADEVTERASNAARELSNRVEQQPLTAILVAAGAGLMLGLLFGRR